MSPPSNRNQDSRPGPPTLQFLGAAGTVTGSKHLIRCGGKEILLDCGMFQGTKDLRLRNWERPPVPAKDIDAVILSHAHIDHTGYLPLLVREGYRGPIYCTLATAQLLPILLLDAAHLQEEDAERANRYGYSKHHPALPLYTAKDAQNVFRLVETAPFGREFTVINGVRGMFRRAGHILGAASIEVQFGDPQNKLVFSGDLGRWGWSILRDPELVPEADVLLVESTYGDRLHPPDPMADLARFVTEAAARGGALIIPAFAVDRTQELIWALRRLEDEKRIPVLPVYIDSPMAIEVTSLYCQFPDENRLDVGDLMDRDRCPLRCHRMEFMRSPAESKSINDMAGPMIIISSSGMATGGRVLHHLAHRVSDPRTTVLLAGFQAAGTRGRSLQDGAPTLRIHGRDIPVTAQVRQLGGFSAHGDRDELMRWLAGFRRPPRQCYLVHGEPAVAQSFAQTIRERLKWTVQVAEDGATVPLTGTP